MSQTFQTNVDSELVEALEVRLPRLPYHAPQIAVLGLIDSVVTANPGNGADLGDPGISHS